MRGAGVSHHITKISATLCALTLVCTTSATAYAQEETPQERMHTLNEKGFGAFRAGDHASAARYFRQAHDIYPDPNLLKNESIAWFKAGDCDRAKRAAADFLVADNTASQDRDDARQLIATCSLREVRSAYIAQDYARANMLMGVVREQDLDDEGKREQRELRTKIDEALARQARVASTEPDAAPPGARRDALGKVLLGTGGALLLGGILYHSVAWQSGRELKEISASGGSAVRYNVLARRLDRARVVVPTLYALGAASTGVGAYLVWSVPPEERVTSSLSPPEVQGVVLTFSAEF